MDDVPVSDEVDPRIERSRHHVLAATVDLLREVGYGRLTIEAVAARSGVAKSTIYRHWPGKAELVTDAFLTLKPRSAEPPPGPVRERVTAVLTGIVESLSAPANNLACVMPALIDAAERVPEMATLSRRLAEQSAIPLRGVLDDAVAAGELPPGTDTALLADSLLGPIMLCRLFHRQPITVGDVPTLVDQTLPLVGPVPARPPG
jgi:AcrR family transcriptional regulator